MSSASLGRLANAPLAYVLVQVRFLPVLDLEKYIPALHSALRGVYPRCNPIPNPFMQFGGLQAPEGMLPVAGWEFASAENKKGIILHTTSLVLHVTEYTTFDDFKKQLGIVMKNVAEHIPNIFVDRVGIRYVDYIIPDEGLSPDLYIFDGIRCVPKLNLDASPTMGFAMTQYKMAEGSMVVKYLRGFGLPQMPPDLAFSIERSEIMSTQVDDSIETGMLDTDRFIEVSIPYDVDVLLTYFDRMHDDISNLFKAIVTPYALEKWGSKPRS